MQLYLLLYIVLEVSLFVFIGQQIGFLLMISLYLLVSILGLIVCRHGIWRIAHLHEQLIQQIQEQQDLSELSEEFISRINLKLKYANNRLAYFALAQIAFIVPGLITEIIAVLLMVRALLFNFSSEQEGGIGSWFWRSLQKTVPKKYYSRYSSYDEEMYQRYGKSERDIAREAEEAAAKANEKVPQPNEKAGHSSVADIKAKFQENKVIKEAHFEEIIEDEPKEDVSVKGAGAEDSATRDATSGEKKEQSHQKADGGIFKP